MDTKDKEALAVLEAQALDHRYNRRMEDAADLEAALAHLSSRLVAGEAVAWRWRDGGGDHGMWHNNEPCKEDHKAAMLRDGCTIEYAYTFATPPAHPQAVEPVGCVSIRGGYVHLEADAEMLARARKAGHGALLYAHPPARQGGAREAVVPEGWRLECLPDGQIKLTKDGIGDYSKVEVRPGHMLHLFFTAMLAAAPKREGDGK